MASSNMFPDQSSGVDSNLLQALAQYVTTGTHAHSTTEKEIQDLAQQAMSNPGNRAQLNALIAGDQSPDNQVWNNKAPADGTINIIKTHLSISLGVDILGLKFEAASAGFFVPFSGPLNGGTLSYNDSNQLAPGTATFRIYASGLDLYVNIYSNQVHVGNFHFTNVPFLLPPGGVDLNGNIV